jgi:hypothetical protein
VNLFAQVAKPESINLLKYGYNHLYSLSTFRIWGWSEDGKVAYSIERCIDGTIYILHTAVIFDFIDDVFVWKNMITDDEDLSEDDYIDFYKEYEMVCIQNNIEPIQTDFKELPISHNNYVFNIIIDIIDEEETRYFDDIESYRVIVETRGKKKIVKQKNDVWAFDVLPCGYFISPYENRALIVIAERVPGFEGADIEFYFIGCHLTYGFN